MHKYLFKSLLLLIFTFPTSAEVEEFIKPEISGLRLDWCLSWAADCGEPVAYKWCQNKGYSKPLYWEQEKSIGAKHPTTMLNSRDTCYKNSCDGFRTIVCYRSSD